ncbi:MAG: ABC transporter permease [Rivularia sp. (in: Bacteria)]|nr:ABC transporter permease [Rivularia sp. MS3]
MQIKLQPRNTPSQFWLILSPLVALLGTIFSGIILFSLNGKSPILALEILLISPLINPYAITEIIVQAAPILLIAVGLAICFHGKIWNIGAEGQFIIGAIFGSAVAIFFPNINNYSLLFFCLVAGIIGGAAWASIPALLKVQFNANEILTSLMLNYIAISLLNYSVRGPLQDTQGFNFPESAIFSEFATLPPLIPGTRLHLGIIFAAIAAIIVWLILSRSQFGFSVRVVGASVRAAEYAGINRKRIIWLSFLLSGSLAGLAGVCEVSGLIGQLRATVSPGYGFTAIIAAFIGRLNPLMIILSSLLLAQLYVGSELLQIKLGLPSALASIFQGILLLILLSTDLLIYNKILITNR